MVVPSRAWVDEVNTLKKGDVYVGRGSKQRGLLPSFWANRNKGSKFGREREQSICIGRKFARIHNTVSECMSCRARGYCAIAGATEKCHADNLRELSIDRHPHAFDPTSSARPPLSSELNIPGESQRRSGRQRGIWTGRCGGRCSARLARNRETHSRRIRVRGKEACVMVKVSVLQGPGLQEIAVILLRSCGRVFRACSSRLLNPSPRFSSCRNSLWVVMREPPFNQDVVKRLRDDVKVILARCGRRQDGMCQSTTDSWAGLLKAAADPEVSIASFAQGVRVGPGSRMPRCPKLYTKKKKWRIPEQREQVDVDEVLATQGVWNKNYSTLSSFRAEVEEVLRDQAGRGQYLIMPGGRSKRPIPELGGREPRGAEERKTWRSCICESAL